MIIRISVSHHHSGHVSMIPDLAHSLTAIGIPAQFSDARTTADGNTPNAYILYSFWIWRKRETLLKVVQSFVILS